MARQEQPSVRRLPNVLLRALAAISFSALTLLAAAPVGGDARAETGALERSLRSALLELYSLDARLATSRERLRALEARIATLRAQRHALARELSVARRGLRVSQQRLDSRLRLLYRHGGTTTLEIVLGARSLGDALADLEHLRRVTVVNEQLLDELRAAKARTTRSSLELTRRTRELTAAAREAAATTRALERARDERAAFVSTLRRQLELERRQLERLAATSERAVARTRELGPAPAVAAPRLTAAADRSGPRTLTVTAVAYTLPGTTATGLPVGHGVVAVDPAVIPLGTRMTIPGYGEAVAADTGGAVTGLMIDVWVPTAAKAAAWGTRTVTITLH